MTHPHPRAIATAASAQPPGCCSPHAAAIHPPTPHRPRTPPAARPAPLRPTVGATSSVPPTGGTTACSLITEQEAGTALGADPGPGQDATAHGASSCIYGTSPEIVTVNMLPTGGKAAYDHARALAPADRLIDVAGVGAAAFGLFTGPAANIWFYQGDTMIAIGLITGGAATPPKDQATALAKTAAS